jgi:hypothetical protein
MHCDENDAQLQRLHIAPISSCSGTTEQFKPGRGQRQAPLCMKPRRKSRELALAPRVIPAIHGGNMSSPSHVVHPRLERAAIHHKYRRSPAQEKFPTLILM